MLRIIVLILAVSFWLRSTLSQTKNELNRETSTVFQAADQKMNEVYEKILDLYSRNTLFIKNLRTAQDLWLQYRDAQLAVMYPDRFEGYYGSVLPICKGAYLAKLTNARTRELEVWLNKSSEFDVCNSTVGEYEFPEQK